MDEEIAELRRQYDALLEAEAGSNADDEHDPEGTTLAFERQQLLAVIERFEQKRADILRGTTGTCETCGKPIGDERLAARPYARTCVDCASRL
ncbi:MAG: transcriptional regulator, TraR/DksA family [Frankiales bacterium]|nr:transcriptional regulator, TraR/DksA family [Frankiales bacterium]